MISDQDQRQRRNSDKTNSNIDRSKPGRVIRLIILRLFLLAHQMVVHPPNVSQKVEPNLLTTMQQSPPFHTQNVQSNQKRSVDMRKLVDFTKERRSSGAWPYFPKRQSTSLSSNSTDATTTNIEMAEYPDTTTKLQSQTQQTRHRRRTEPHNRNATLTQSSSPPTASSPSVSPSVCHNTTQPNIDATDGATIIITNHSTNDQLDGNSEHPRPPRRILSSASSASSTDTSTESAKSRHYTIPQFKSLKKTESAEAMLTISFDASVRQTRARRGEKVHFLFKVAPSVSDTAIDRHNLPAVNDSETKGHRVEPERLTRSSRKTSSEAIVAMLREQQLEDGPMPLRRKDSQSRGSRKPGQKKHRSIFNGIKTKQTSTDETKAEKKKDRER